ncbi:MAG: hypothetical protein WD738_08020 [Pirellulales bacterium]
MADQEVKVRDVAWSELFPCLMLLRSIRIALMARVLVLGAAGLIATTLGWWLLGQAFAGSGDPLIERWRATSGPWIWEDSREFWVATSARSADEVFYSASEGLVEAPVAIWLFFTRPFIDLFRADLTPIGFLFLLLCCVWELLVWGVAAGAITRIAALKFTRDEAPGPLAALKQAARKLPSYSLPPLVALAGAAVFAVQLALVGVLMRLDLLAFVFAILWPFVLLLGLLMAVLLLGAVVGWPLMWSTVSVEGTDAFDALSRSYAYTYHRPLRLLCYVLFAAVLAVVSMFVVKLFAASAIALGDWSVDWGLDRATMREVVWSDAMRLEIAGAPSVSEFPPPEAPDEIIGPDELDDEPGALRSWARRAVYFWKSLVAALAAGYQAGFLWVSAVGVYLLLRRDIDGVQLNEVYVDQADEYGMPPLADEATTGVPEVAPGAPAQPGDTAV